MSTTPRPPDAPDVRPQGQPAHVSHRAAHVGAPAPECAPAVIAALLRRGRDVDRCAELLGAVGLLCAVAAWTPLAAQPRVLLFVGGATSLALLAQKYWAARVALDADLFELGDAVAIDATLVSLGLLAAQKASRPWPARADGALRLLRRQFACIVVQLACLGIALAALHWPA